MDKYLVFTLLALFFNLNSFLIRAEDEKANILRSESQGVFLESPNKLIKAEFFIQSNKVYYQLNYKNTQVIDTSALGLQFENGDLINKKIEFGKSLTLYQEEKIQTKFGEATEIHTQYNELSLPIMNVETQSLRLRIVVRAYNEGFSFRYIIPKPKSETVWITSELTEFALLGNPLVYENTWHEDTYRLKHIPAISKPLEMPVVLKGDNFFLCIDEADNQNYERILYSKKKENTLKATLKNKVSLDSENYTTPWRYIKFAETPEKLASLNFFNYSMCPSSVFDQEDWIIPGKAFRCMDLTSEGIKKSIDFAKKMNFKYILLDAGWYGLGYYEQSNKASDPKIPVAEIDMPNITKYANENNVGLILYVNWVALHHYPLEETFALYEKWGIKGVKFGFVNGKSQAGLKFIHKAVEIAGRHHLIVNIHDNYRPTGLSRTYPNLLTQEGIRGNEYQPSPTHNATLSFTRFVSGAADYTVSYPKTGTEDNSVTTRGHQLALSVIFFSPLQHIFWYRRPHHLTDELEIEFFKYVPTTWDETVWLPSKIGNYVVVARRQDDTWYLGAITNNTTTTMDISLDFLDTEKEYVGTIYKDSLSTISVDSVRARSSDMLTLELQPRGGQGIIFRPVIDSLPVGTISEETANRKINIYPNPADQIINIDLNSSSFYNNISRLFIYNYAGQQVLSHAVNGSDVQIDVSDFSPGIYILQLETEQGYFLYKFIRK